LFLSVVKGYKLKKDPRHDHDGSQQLLG
jgi:hypothetical protein